MATTSQVNNPAYLDHILYRKIILHEDLTHDELEHLSTHGGFSYRTICETVSSQTESSITGCPCAYEHEYFDCVQNDGGIDHRMLDRICERIKNGECEHVVLMRNTVSNVVVTMVTALHVAIASDNSNLYEKLSDEISRESARKTVILRLTEFNLAVIKRNYSYIKYHKLTRSNSTRAFYHTAPFTYLQKANVEHRQTDDKPFIYKWRFTLDPNCTCFIVCAQQQDIEMLKHVLACKCYLMFILSAIEYSIQEGLVRIFEILFDHVIQNPKTLADHGIKVATDQGFMTYTQDAILYNRPESLRVLQRHNALSKETFGFKKLTTLDIALLLGYEECADILRDSMSESKGVAENLNLYSLFLQSIKLETTLCVRLLKRLSVMGHDINKVTKTQTPPLTVAVHSLPIVNPIIIQTMFDLGADVNLTEPFSRNELGNNVLLTLLSNSCRGKHGRAILKIILYQNPDLNCRLSDKYSRKAVECDKGWRYNPKLSQTSERIVEFSIVGPEPIEDGDTEPDIHRFVLPLLWQCGFLVFNTLLVDDIHPVLNSFIREVTSQPISLQMQCRNTLRSHFTGSNIHRFLEICQCPKSIKDYILLSKVLLE